MQQYRLKSGGSTAVFEAVQLTSENVGEVTNWTQGQIVTEYDMRTNEELVGLNLRSNGEMRRASEGEVIVLFEGDFFVMKKHLFDRKYVPYSPDTYIQDVKE
jgi:hypothetical protein